jgi:hypothetical protein
LSDETLSTVDLAAAKDRAAVDHRDRCKTPLQVRLEHLLDRTLKASPVIQAALRSSKGACKQSAHLISVYDPERCDLRSFVTPTSNATAYPHESLIVQDDMRVADFSCQEWTDAICIERFD